jgi:hypothetical protein
MSTTTSASTASTPAIILTGAIFTGGTGTTTTPHFLIQPSTATPSTAYNTTGTAFGINVHTGIANLFDLQQDGISRFVLSANSGSVTMLGSLTVTGAGSNINTAAAGQFAWSTRAILSSPAAGKIQLGTTDANAPVAQTLQAQSVAAGNTNTAGATLTIAGSKSNGSGGGDVVLQTTLSTAASGTQNTLVPALTLKGGSQRVVAAAPINLAQFTVATLPTATLGDTAFVTDSTTTIVLGLGNAVIGGGTNKVPVYADGTNWIIG